MEKIPSNSEGDEKKAYESNLQEAIKLSSGFNELMEERKEDEYIKNGKGLSKLYKEREEVKDRINENIVKRIELLCQGGLKKLEERINDIPKLKQAFENMKNSYLYNTTTRIEEAINRPFCDGLTSILLELGYQMGGTDEVNERITFKKGDKNFNLQFSTKPSKFGIGKESRIVSLQIFKEVNSEKQEICRYAGEWIMVPEDTVTQREVDVLVASLG